jgi:23S rRNA (guanosine2251-2'-O)-methyltransferase
MRQDSILIRCSERRRKIDRAKQKTTHVIPGFHGVMTALDKGRPRIETLWIARGKGSQRSRELLRIAKEKGIPVHHKDRADLDRLLPGTAHQGIAALVEKFEYTDLERIIAGATKTRGLGLIVIADHITDEGNLGALIRTAAFFGAHGLVLPKDRSAQVTGTVLKRSVGAHAHLPVARVVNLGRALDDLNRQGFWIIGAAGEGPESIYRFDWTRDLALVVGREDRGLTHIVRERCHQLVTIPGTGQVDSLNVSVACGIVLSEIARQRGQV